VEFGKTLRRSDAKTCVGPEREGWWEVVIRSFGADEASEKNEVNSSLARSSWRSGSSGSVIRVSSYSRRFSSVAGIFVFSRSWSVNFCAEGVLYLLEFRIEFLFSCPLFSFRKFCFRFF